MRFYRIEKNGEIVGYSKTNISSTDECFVEITEVEYNSAIEELRAQNEAEAEAIAAAEQSKDERIAELEAENSKLEAENAALLYQVLTGEELADV